MSATGQKRGECFPGPLCRYASTLSTDKDRQELQLSVPTSNTVVLLAVVIAAPTARNQRVQRTYSTYVVPALSVVKVVPVPGHGEVDTRSGGWGGPVHEPVQGAGTGPQR